MRSMINIIRKCLVLALTICSMSYLTGCCDQLMPKAKPENKMANQLKDGKPEADVSKPEDSSIAATSPTSTLIVKDDAKPEDSGAKEKAEAKPEDSGGIKEAEAKSEDSSGKEEAEEIPRISTEELD